jgi:hypothetical protein
MEESQVFTHTLRFSFLLLRRFDLLVSDETVSLLLVFLLGFFTAWNNLLGVLVSILSERIAGGSGADDDRIFRNGMTENGDNSNVNNFEHMIYYYFIALYSLNISYTTISLHSTL